MNLKNMMIDKSYKSDMKIEKIIINNKHQGYLFRFQPVDQLVSSSDIKGSPGKF